MYSYLFDAVFADSLFKNILSSHYVFRSPVYFIFDSEMKTLEVQEYQVELYSMLDQKKSLDEAYERQRQWIEEREHAIKKELKALSPSASDTLKDKTKRAVK